MLVGRGSLTFRTYRVSGKNPQPEPKTVCSKLDKFKFSGLGASDEGTASGWVAPDHLFDGDFEDAKIMRGPFATFALRIDTRKVPSGLLNAHVALEEKAAREASGQDRVPPAERRRIKRDVKAKLLKETPPAQRAFGVFWKVRERKLYFQTTSKTPNTELIELFARTFDLELVPSLPGSMAHDVAREHDLVSGLTDAKPMKLTAGQHKKKKSSSKEDATRETAAAALEGLD